MLIFYFNIFPCLSSAIKTSVSCMPSVERSLLRKDFFSLSLSFCSLCNNKGTFVCKSNVTFFMDNTQIISEVPVIKVAATELSADLVEVISIPLLYVIECFLSQNKLPALILLMCPEILIQFI